MTPDAILFWIISVLTLVSALFVILVPNPVFSALSLALTMVGVSAIFVTLGAYFLAGVQLIVYAGAVMVLFVMVLMLFDLKHELQAFTHGKVSGLVKLGSVGLLAGLFVGAILMSAQLIPSQSAESLAEKADQTKALGKLLFSQYLFGFEALGALLLIVAVGAVALSRSKGALMLSTNFLTEIGLEHFLILSALLFSIGMTGVLLRRNAIVLLMSIELMLNAVNVSFVAFSHYSGKIEGQIMVFFVMTIAAAEAAVGLALAVSIFKRFKEVNIRFFEQLRG